MSKTLRGASTRITLALAVLTSTCGTGGNPEAAGLRSSVTATPAITVLAGPLTAIGSPADLSGIGSYDAAELQRATVVAKHFPEQPEDLMTSNYYDLALVLYVAYYRSGDTSLRGEARRIAKAWRDSPANQSIEPFLAGNYSVGPNVPQPRGLSTLGLAVLALESDDAAARHIVDEHAKLVEQAAWAFKWSDPRETGYSLMALVASTMLGDDHRASASRLLDVILSAQKPDGRWEATSDLVPSGPFVLNYMTGLLMEALVLYDRQFGDPRIMPAIQRCIDWTWTTQWLPAQGTFQYGNVNSGTVNTHPAADLNGLMLPAWGYAFSVTGDSRYRDQGNQIFAGLVAAIPSISSDEKHYAQMYRSSGRYLGFIAQSP